MKNKNIVLLIASVITVINTDAQNIDQIAVKIANDNPSVANAVYEDRIKAAELRGENKLADPEVEVEQLWGNKEIGNKLTVGISQEFQLPSVYSRRKRVAEGLERAASLKSDAERFRLSVEAKQVILEIVYTRQSISLMQESLANLDSIYKLSDKAYRGGEMTLLDHKKLNVQSVLVKQKIADLKSQLPALYGQLSSMGDGSDYSQLVAGIDNYPIEQMHSLDEYLAIASDKDYMLKYNTSLADNQEAAVKSLAAERWPSLSLGYVYNREAGATFNGFSLGLSLPVYSSKNKRAAINLEQEGLLRENVSISAEQRAEITSLYDEVTTLKGYIDALRPEVAAADVRDLLDKAYDKKVITVIDYITELTYFIDARQSLLDTEFRYHSALAKLNSYYSF